METNNETKTLQSMRETHEKFTAKNADKIKEKHICKVCYGMYTYFNKSSHKKTRRHIRAVETSNNENN